MDKTIKITQFRFLSFKNPKNIKAVSLVELMVSIVVVGTMVLSFYSLETYSHQQVMSADRRTKVQNSLSFCLEHMTKYVQQANGNMANPAIVLIPGSGFKVRVDSHPMQTPPAFSTPSDLSDDVWVSYSLSGNTLSTSCTPIGAVTCGSILSENLSSKIVANFNNSVLPDSPTDGFYVAVDSSGNFVDIGLVGRYIPAEVTTPATRLTNPQVAMKTRLICNNSSTN